MLCLLCEKDCTMKFSDPTETLHPNVDGTAFEATGNFGSTIWDSGGTHFLQLVICNDCLPTKEHLIDYVSYNKPQPKLTSRIPFGIWNTRDHK